MIPKNLIRTDEDGVCHLQFSSLEIEALLVVLNLAKTAATVLANQDLSKTATTISSSKMTKVASDANELMRIIAESVSIGEPGSHEYN